MPGAGVSEDALIQSILAGDRQAFYELVSPYEGKAYRAAYAMLQNPADAEEVVQEAFFKAFEHLKSFRGQAKFSTWLLQIVLNEGRLRLRRSRLIKEESLDDPVETEEGFVPRELRAWQDNPEEKYAAEELRERVRGAMATLPPIYRVVVLLRDMEGLDNEATATALSLSVPAVKSRLARARLMLRERLSRQFRKRWFDRLPFRRKAVRS